MVADNAYLSAALVFPFVARPARPFRPAAGLCRGPGLSGAICLAVQSLHPALRCPVGDVHVEPEDLCMALAGLACGGWQMFRRRRLRQAPTLAA